MGVQGGLEAFPKGSFIPSGLGNVPEMSHPRVDLGAWDFPPLSSLPLKIENMEKLSPLLWGMLAGSGRTSEIPNRGG